MTVSSHWDESRAARYNRFRYDFPERSLAGRAVIVAGGTGGLGAALVAYLAREGVELIVGYHAKRERADSLRDAMEEQFGRKILLVKGDLSDPSARGDFLNAARRLALERRAILAGAAIFPGDPARVAFEALDQKALEASLSANYVGPLLLAKEIGQFMEEGEGGNVVLLASMQAVAAISFQFELRAAESGPGPCGANPRATVVARARERGGARCHRGGHGQSKRASRQVRPLHGEWRNPALRPPRRCRSRHPFFPGTG